MCKRSVGYTILVPCHGKWKNNTCQSNNQMLKKTYFNITSPLNIRVGNVEGSMVHTDLWQSSPIRQRYLSLLLMLYRKFNAILALLTYLRTINTAKRKDANKMIF